MIRSRLRPNQGTRLLGLPSEGLYFSSVMFASAISRERPVFFVCSFPAKRPLAHFKMAPVIILV